VFGRNITLRYDTGIKRVFYAHVLFNFTPPILQPQFYDPLKSMDGTECENRWKEEQWDRKDINSVVHESHLRGAEVRGGCHNFIAQGF